MNKAAVSELFPVEYVPEVKKPKIFQLGISKVFLKTHPKSGQPTDFRTAIEEGRKIHTLRKNYAYWKKVEEKVNSGYGILSLRQWEDQPYKSPRPEFHALTRMRVEHILIQTKGFGRGSAAVTVYINWSDCTSQLDLLARNDGFDNAVDLIHWLGWKGFDGCIIHFTDFTYQNL